MQNMGQAMLDVLTQSSTLSPFEEHVCPHCKRTVPRLTLSVLGKEKYVQPYCRCEVLAVEGGINESVELQKKREIESRFAISSLGERFAESTFEKFNVLPGTEKALEYCQSYAKAFTDYGGESIMLWGSYGNGKSHLAAAVAHTIQNNGHTAVFQTMPELLERVRSTFSNGKSKESEKDIMVALQTCELLLIDDVGAEKISDWVQDVLFRIVDGRYRQKKPIFYTTNLQPSDLKDKVGPRIYDRMVETSLLVQNTGTSYRMKIAENRFRQMKMEGV